MAAKKSSSKAPATGRETKIPAPTETPVAAPALFSPDEDRAPIPVVAEGDTIVNRLYNLERGVQPLEEKLSNVGADIERQSA